MVKHNHYLLIVSCSNRKHKNPAPIFALERYDGIFHRVIKKTPRPQNLDILILSAEYGLISETTPVQLYDRKMDKARAIELRPRVETQLNELLENKYYAETFINLGVHYQSALLTVNAVHLINTHGGNIIHASGGIGMKASQMKKWLIEKGKLC